MATHIVKEQGLPVLKSAWYQKSEATFSDIIALVRRHIWASKYYANSSKTPEHNLIEDDFVNVLIELVCYAA